MTEVQPFSLSTPDASAYLKQRYGISYTPKTLGKLRTLGGGPKYQKIGYRGPVVYPVTLLDEWAVQKLGSLIGSDKKGKEFIGYYPEQDVYNIQAA